jgi:O-antigen/teichoic acid export membrane protein
LLLFNAQGNALNYIVFQFTYTLVIFIVTLLALFWSGIGEFSRVFGIFVADFVFAVIGIRMVFKDLDISFSLPTGTLINFDFLKFGIGLVPHLIASVLLSSVDKVLIASRLSMTDLASYAIAVQFTSILMIYTQGIGKEWSRCYMANRNEGWVVKRGVTFTVSIFVIAAITYATKSVFFLIFVGEGYTVLDNVIIALLIGQICHAVYMIVSVEIIYQRKTHILSTLTVLSLTINIIVSLLLVEQYGVFGVALGTMAGMAAKVTAVSIFTYSARMQLSTGK